MYESLMHAIYHALVYRYTVPGMYGTRYQGYPDTIPVMVPGTWYSYQSANNQQQEQPSVMQRTSKDALVEYHLRYMVIV